jgi:hypothetical protein
MWYNTIDVKYWQRSDNKCQFRLRGFTSSEITSLISTTYSGIGLAQKLHYFLSPIKNTYW